MNVLTCMENTAGSRGFCALSENHFSNMLYFLLNPETSGKETSTACIKALLAIANLSIQRPVIKSVERERVLHKNKRPRLIDLVVVLSNSVELHIENKTDRNYEDIDQLKDELDALGPKDHLVLLCPRGKSLLRAGTRSLLASGRPIHHAQWGDVASAWNQLGRTAKGAYASLLVALDQYWQERTNRDFLWQVETIVEETNWSRFYPDDFKDAYVKRFPQCYEALVNKNGKEFGRGGAHMILTTQLVSLTKRVNCGFSLRKTGRERAPRERQWGYPTVYEYEVVGH